MTSNAVPELDHNGPSEQETGVLRPSAIYAALQSKEIRLLHLESATDTQTALSGFFQVVNFQTTPKPAYEALSYAWEGAFNDDVLPQDRIELRDNETGVEIKTLSITGNLANALRRLRHHPTTRVLWVDALCINQDDVAERSAQVQNMSTIYTEARRVITWLGEDSSTQDGEAVLHCIERSLLQDNPLTQESQEALAACRAAKKFWTRRYFSRRWIIQEYTLARSILIVCGSHSVEWAVKCDLRTWARELPTALGEGREHVLDPKHLESKYWLHPDASSLDNVLVAYHGLNCSDPRDRIYALLSLFDHENAVQVDYTLPWPQVYHKFMQTVIDEIAPAFTSRNFTVIYRLLCVAASQAASTLQEFMQSELPSWVPSWLDSIAAHDAEGLDIYWNPNIFIDYYAGLYGGEGTGQYLLLFVEEYEPVSGVLEVGGNIDPIYCPQYVVEEGDCVVGPRYADVRNNLRAYVNAVGGCLLLRRIPMLRDKFRLVGRCALRTTTEGEGMFRSTRRTFHIL